MDRLTCFLSIFTPACSTCSVIIIIAALGTTDWIRTDENVPNPNYQYNASDSNRYLSKLSRSGILEICTQYPENFNTTCKSIEYFTSEGSYPNPNNSDSAISYAVRQSVFFFVVAFVIQIFGEIGYLCGHCLKQRRIFLFVGGTIFIVSGLVMMIGIVMFVSVFKTEIGNKLKPQSPTGPPMLSFQYGMSFMLYLFGFLSVELSGTCAVMLFISEQEAAQIRVNHVFEPPPPPIVYAPENYTISANPGVVYPCQKHPQVCIISGTTPILPRYILEHPVYDSSQYERDMPPRRYIYNNQVENSPPYMPATNVANDSCSYERSEWEYQNPNSMERQRTVGLQVDMIEEDVLSNNNNYLNHISPANTLSRRQMRQSTQKSTLV